VPDGTSKVLIRGSRGAAYVLLESLHLLDLLDAGHLIQLAIHHFPPRRFWRNNDLLTALVGISHDELPATVPLGGEALRQQTETSIGKFLLFFVRKRGGPTSKVQ